MRHYSAWVSEADQRAAGTIAPRMPARPQPADLPPRVEIEPKHPFERIAVDLRERIYAGDLRIGLPIPSVKELAREHGISASTAQRAIQLLSQWGLVRVEPGRPTFVAPREKNVVEVTATPADTVAPSQALELEVRRLGTGSPPCERGPTPTTANRCTDSCSEQSTDTGASPPRSMISNWWSALPTVISG
jgi:DNA-binding transcriptional regulator YhcF (GntR family)